MHKREQIGPIIDEVNSLARAGQFLVIDQKLADLDFNTISEIEMVAWLRSAFPMRQLLPSWKTTLVHAIFTSEARGFDRFVTKGLDQD